MALWNFLKFLARILVKLGLKKYSIFRKLYFQIGRKLFGNFILYEGQKFFIDVEGSLERTMFGFDNEKYELSIFKKMIKKGDVVVDVGANMGLYTLISAKLVGDSGKVYSFEPDPVAFSILSKNVTENSYNNVVLINKAVTNKTGFEKFSTDSDESLSVANYLLKEEPEKFVTVETITLDDFFKNMSSNMSIVKMDVEGAEFKALKRLENLIKQNKDLKLFLEFYPFTLNRSGVSISDFVDYINNLDFRIYNIDEKSKTTTLVNKEWLLTFAKTHSLLVDGYTNILCIKNKI